MALLQVIKGPVPGQQFHLVKEKIIMGRHPDCDIVIDVGAVSRQHAQILIIDGTCFVEDLKSRNGTFVNEQQVADRRALKDQDEVKICDMVFTFRDQAPSATLAHIPSNLGEVELKEEPDDQEQDLSTIMNKVDVSSSLSALRVSVNPEVKLRALMEVTQSLAKSLSLDDVLPKILDSLFKVFIQADRGFIVIPEPATGKMITRAYKYRRGNTDDTPRFSRTIFNEAISSKTAILSADAINDKRFGMSESIADFRIRSMMCAPMLDSEGRPLGIIQVDTQDQRARFQPDDLEVLASVASQAAFAIENANLHETALRQQAIQRDLNLAQKIQKGFLPSAKPVCENYEFFDFYTAASEVGGDYYDYIELPNNHIGVICADVSGKGIPAALIMAKISAEAKFYLGTVPDPAQAIMRLNRSFSAAGIEDRFCTLCLTLLNPHDHTVTVVNAGHMPPMVRKSDGSVVLVGEAEAGLPLGVYDEFDYEAFRFQLQPGDSVTMYTDGISEAMNSNKDIYDDPDHPRIRTQLESYRGTSMVEMGQQLLEDVRKFVNGYKQSDDMCLVCYSRKS